MPTVTVDGNQAAASIAYALSETAFIFPITPATTMGELADVWANQGRKNVFGQTLSISQMQSEGGAAGSVHGACTAGSLVSTFTSSQGLLLMIPDMFKISGELLPCVIHVASRCVGTQGISIYVDNNDVMATRTTGFAMLSSSSVQEAADLALAAHLSTIQSRIPFLHFFDGFRTSHEICKIELPTNEDLLPLIDQDALADFRSRSLNPMHGMMRGTVEGSEIYFQNQERSQEFYNRVPDIVEKNLEKIAAKFGRKYSIVDYYGDADAEHVIVMLGSGAQTVMEYLEKKQTNKKVGLLVIRLYRPFPVKMFLDKLPKTTKSIAVLDRMKEFGAVGEPLYEEISTLMNDVDADKRPILVGGRFGLGGKEFTPNCVEAVYKNLEQKKPKNHFTVGIIDDICHSHLDVGEWIDATPPETTQCMFWGLGSDGTVGANHDAIKIIGDNTPLHVQGYFYYDAHKSGGVTVSHLRFGKHPIRSEYLVKQADYLACHLDAYIGKYDLLDNIKTGGIFVINTAMTKEDLEAKLPGSFKRQLVEKKVKLYTIDASSIAEKVGLGRRINTVMQAVFFTLANVLPFEQSIKLITDAVKKTFANKGEKVINMNINAINAAKDNLVQVAIPEAWKNSELEAAKVFPDHATDFVKNVLAPTMEMKGDSLPVSAFEAGGANPLGLTKYEKRGIAPRVPVWNIDKCVGCNECSIVCPHAVIRPFLLSKEEAEKVDFPTKDAKGKNAGLKFRIQMSPYDCTGCSLCTKACRFGALEMGKFEDQKDQQKNWDTLLALPNKAGNIPKNTVIGSQFYQPLLEFSGCCEGCSETAYVKLLTQLFGSRLVVANASGCSSVWGGTWGMIPYTTTEKGYGPAWSNSLFEENAEFGFGMAKANSHRRELLKARVEKLLAESADKLPAPLVSLAKEWLSIYDDGEKVEKLSHDFRLAIEAGFASNEALVKPIYEHRDVINILSHWAIGGDGWAYDINYGGLDHVIAQGHNMNILVLDTEMYSNTGGQKSKATNIGAVAKFAAGGNRKFKKDLGRIAMTYGDIYVGSISLQANPSHALKTLMEAEAYPGTSLVLCYAPCKEQGFPLADALEESKIAVESGYWSLYRYDPRKTPAMQLDQGKLTREVSELLSRENRYMSLTRANPEVAKDLHAKLAGHKKNQRAEYERLTQLTETLKEAEKK